MTKNIEYEIKFDYKTKTITKIVTTTQEIKLSDVSNNPQQMKQIAKELKSEHNGEIINSFYGWYGFNFYFLKTDEGIKFVKNDDQDLGFRSFANYTEYGFKQTILSKCFTEDEWNGVLANLPVELSNMPESMIWRK